MKIDCYPLNHLLKDAKTEDLIKELQIRLPNCKITIDTSQTNIAYTTCQANSNITDKPFTQQPFNFTNNPISK